MSFRRFTADSGQPEFFHVRTGHQQWQQETAMLDMTWELLPTARWCVGQNVRNTITTVALSQKSAKNAAEIGARCGQTSRRLIAPRQAPGVDTERVANSSDRKFSRKESWQLSIALVLWDDMQPARAGCISSTAIGRSSPCRGRWPRCGCCRAGGNW